jgi:hypothetical protein
MGLFNIREVEYTALPIRAILAVVISIGLVVGFLAGLIQPADYKEVTLLIIVFYFAKRSVTDEQPNGSNPPPKIKDPPRLSENPAE